jgi:hypothetical protein
MLFTRLLRQDGEGWTQHLDLSTLLAEYVRSRPALLAEPGRRRPAANNNKNNNKNNNSNSNNSKQSEQELHYARLIRRAYLLASNTVGSVMPWPEVSVTSREDNVTSREGSVTSQEGMGEGDGVLFLTGQESGDLVVWSLSGTV